MTWHYFVGLSKIKTVDSAQPRNCSIVTRPFSPHERGRERVGSGHQTIHTQEGIELWGLVQCCKDSTKSCTDQKTVKWANQILPPNVPTLKILIQIDLNGPQGEAYKDLDWNCYVIFDQGRIIFRLLYPGLPHMCSLQVFVVSVHRTGKGSGALLKVGMRNEKWETEMKKWESICHLQY